MSTSNDQIYIKCSPVDVSSSTSSSSITQSRNTAKKSKGKNKKNKPNYDIMGSIFLVLGLISIGFAIYTNFGSGAGSNSMLIILQKNKLALYIASAIFISIGIILLII
jgi:hypothetical protein